MSYRQQIEGDTFYWRALYIFCLFGFLQSGFWVWLSYTWVITCTTHYNEV